MWMFTRWMIGGAWALLALIVVAWWLSGGEPPQAASTPTVQVDCALQAERVQFIEQLKRLGVVAKIEQPAALPHVYVGSRFQRLSIDDKRSFMSAIAAYEWCAGQHDLLVLREHRHGRDVGTFSLPRGLALK